MTFSSKELKKSGKADWQIRAKLLERYPETVIIDPSIPKSGNEKRKGSVFALNTLPNFVKNPAWAKRYQFVCDVAEMELYKDPGTGFEAKYNSAVFEARETQTVCERFEFKRSECLLLATASRDGPLNLHQRQKSEFELILLRLFGGEAKLCVQHVHAVFKELRELIVSRGIVEQTSGLRQVGRITRIAEGRFETTTQLIERFNAEFDYVLMQGFAPAAHYIQATVKIESRKSTAPIRAFPQFLVRQAPEVIERYTYVDKAGKRHTVTEIRGRPGEDRATTQTRFEREYGLRNDTTVANVNWMELLEAEVGKKQKGTAGVVSPPKNVKVRRSARVAE